MAKLYFKYGAMGSSKTAQALITKYNYEENDLNVWLIKPGTDTRDGAKILRSRIGLESPADVIAPGTDIYLLFQDTQEGKCDVIIVDECQFLTESQIDQLRSLVNDYNIPVMCFGLRTDFQTRLFPGSRRLMEVADTIQEIKTICDCGAKATVNARIDGDGVRAADDDVAVGFKRPDGKCFDGHIEISLSMTSGCRRSNKRLLRSAWEKRAGTGQAGCGCRFGISLVIRINCMTIARTRHSCKYRSMAEKRSPKSAFAGYFASNICYSLNKRRNGEVRSDTTDGQRLSKVFADKGVFRQRPG